MTETSPTGCEPCLCQTRGTVNGSLHCDVTSGQCLCKDNVDGMLCDKCKYGFYNMDESNSDGCTDCGCNQNGTVGGEAGCDEVTGQCECRPNVSGKGLFSSLLFVTICCMSLVWAYFDTPI